MNIAYIITGLGLGGAEIVTIDIANRMVHAGNRVMLLYLTGNNVLENKIDLQIETIGLHMHKTPLGFLFAVFNACKILNKFSPDIIHGQMFHANIFARILRIVNHFPYLICTEHTRVIGNFLRLKIYRWTDFLADFNTNVSEDAVDYFINKKAFRRSNSKVVYNGINLSKFMPNSQSGEIIRKQYGIPKDNFLFINVGRLMEAKDQHNLIEAFSLLTDAQLMIVGDGELRQDLEQFTNMKGCRSNVVFTGNQQDIQNYYGAADCYVVSSAWEGFSLVVIEAMASGLPVISTDAGGCREAVDNPEWIVPIHNSNALAQKMKYLQSMPIVERQNIGQENRKKAMRYDIESICKEWFELYQNFDR
ncbi:glycosyl transferase [Spirochaetia bacterium]|nr:glycosyl transferase [Spirochaetia bacterium]